MRSSFPFQITVCLIALGLVAGPGMPAYAQAPDTAAGNDADEAPALWEFRLAAFGRFAPAYPAADESDLTILPIPVPVYRGSFLRFGENLDQVARGEIVETSRARIGVDLDFTFGEDSADIAVRSGMPDLDFMLELGPEVEIKLDDRDPEQGEFFLSLQLRAAISFDGLDPASRGLLMNPEFEYRRDGVLGGDNLLSLRWKPTWATEDYMDYYYEVEPAFATIARPVYDATSGYLGSRFTAAVTRQINDRLTFGVSASYYLYNGAENESSPLFQRNSDVSVQAALVWKLAESERRAKPRRQSARNASREREQLAEALREGGYVIVMRHASSPRDLPSELTANPDNVNRERQLDETGRTEAAAMGEALRSRGIVIAEVLSSPTYRAVETARRMGYSDIRLVDELGNEGMSASGEAFAAWLRANVAESPDSGNRLLITHSPNLSAAFGEQAAGMLEGEALIFGPTDDGEPAEVARLEIMDWTDL